MSNLPFTPAIITNNIVLLLNEISKIPEKSLFDKIISYCEKNDFDPQEIGDILEESEQFKLMLHNELENNHVFPKSGPEVVDVDEW